MGSSSDPSRPAGLKTRQGGRGGIIGLRDALPAWTAFTAAVDRIDERNRAASFMRRAVYRTRYTLGAHPALYYPQSRLRYGGRPDYLIDDRTQLVIEAFGRSASTFAALAIQSAQAEPIRIARNTHAAAQVVEAAERRLPTLVIVRKPVEAAAAHMARRRIPARLPLEAWIRYHRRVESVRDSVLIASFDDVTKDLGHVIDRLNARFGTSLAPWEHTPENARGILAEIERSNLKRFENTGPAAAARALARPSVQRDAEKERHRRSLAEPGLSGVLDRAESLYARLVSDSTTSTDTRGGR